MARPKKQAPKPKAKPKTDFEKRIDEAFKDHSLAALYVCFVCEDWRVKEESAKARFGSDFVKIDNPNYKK